MAEYSSSSFAADKVGANSDLLTKILIRVPIRSLMQFKTVSKHWLSLITSDCFSIRHNPDSTAVSGLYLHPYTTTTIPELDFIPLINTTKTKTHQFTDLAFFPGLSGNIRIISSCNGLLLCCFYTDQNNHKPDYVVLNPTTKQFKIVLTVHLSDLIGLTLAFDPSKSPHYKLSRLRWLRYFGFNISSKALPSYYDILIRDRSMEGLRVDEILTSVEFEGTQVVQLVYFVWYGWKEKRIRLWCFTYIPGKTLGYSFGDGDLKEICDVAAPEGFDDEEGAQDMLRYFNNDTFTPI